MSGVEGFVDRLSRRVGGPRVLALPLIRLLAVVSGYVWVLLAPGGSGWDAVDAAMLLFLAYSLALIVVLWLQPRAILRFDFAVLALDLGFALLLIHLTGGASSTLFLALLLIAGLQSYYYGITRGVLVAAASAAAYLAVVWPTVLELEAANMAIRLSVLIGTAIGVGILADVEERERLQVLALSGEMREREQFITSVVESLGEGLIVLDRDGRVVTWNRAMEARYGVTAGDALGRTLADLNPAWKVGAFIPALERLLRGEQEAFALDAVEHQSLHRGRVTLNVKGALLRRYGQPAGAVVLIEDITERVGLERAARQSDKLAALGTLAAGLAHELNNPIGIISSRIELMLLEAESEGASPAMRDDLTVLHRHAQRVAKIVQGLLSFSRLSAGAQQSVDLNRVVDETALLVEKQISKEGIRLERRLRPGLPPVRGDATALQQVLINLIINARDAMGDRGEILVATDRATDRPDHVRLVVRDTGPGIPGDILPRIFDPFFTTKPAGTGLGLSISYGIVREHHGSIDVQTSPGQGTTFVLTFPAETVESAV